MLLFLLVLLVLLVLLLLLMLLLLLRLHQILVSAEFQVKLVISQQLFRMMIILIRSVILCEGGVSLLLSIH